MFLLVLSKIALSILLALGPLFIALLFFETTSASSSPDRAACKLRLCDHPDVLVAALMMGVVSSAAQQAADEGGGIHIADAVRVCMARD